MFAFSPFRLWPHYLNMHVTQDSKAVKACNHTAGMPAAAVLHIICHSLMHQQSTATTHSGHTNLQVAQPALAGVVDAMRQVAALHKLHN